MPYKALTLDGWAAGEYGTIHSREAGRKKEMFHADNVVRSRDGLLMPRAGMRDLEVDGLPSGTLYAGGFGADGMWVLIGDDVYSMLWDWTAPLGETALHYTGASPSFTPLWPLEVEGALLISYLLAPGEGVWKLDHVAHTVSAVPAIPTGRVMRFYQDRLLVGGDGGTNAARLFYSDPGAWETFPGGFIDFPDLGMITSIDPFRTGVLIGGLSCKFVYITGTIGFNEVARYVTFQGAPADPPKRASLATNEILYMADQRPYMETYNGALHNAMPTQTWAGRHFVADAGRATPAYKAVKLIGPDDWMVASGLTGELAFESEHRMMLHYEGIITWHTWEQPVTSMVWHEGSGRQILATNEDDVVTLFVWDTELDRPAFVSDTLSQPGDGSDESVNAFVWTPQTFPPDGIDITVRRLLVDFRKFGTGITDPDFFNHFDVTVLAVNRYGDTGLTVVDPKRSATQSWDEDPALVSDDALVAASGVDQRVAFNVGDQGPASGFELHFDNVRGVGIRSVTVEYDVEPRK